MQGEEHKIIKHEFSLKLGSIQWVDLGDVSRV